MPRYWDSWTVAWYELRAVLTRRKLIFLGIVFFILLLNVKIASLIQLLALIYLAPVTNLPTIFVIPYYIIAALLPFLIIVLSHTVFSRDIEQKTTHFIVPHIHRLSYVFGKFLSMYLLHFILIFLAMLLVVGFSYYHLRMLFLGQALFILIALWLYAASLFSICGLVSAIARRQDISLHATFAVYAVLLIIAFIPGWSSLSPFAYVVGVINAPLVAFSYWIITSLAALAGTAALFQRRNL